MPALIAWLVLALIQPAAAHGTDRHASGYGWTFDPLVVGLIALSALLFAAGTGRLWRRAGVGRGISMGQVMSYASGWLLLGGALLSPLHALGEHMFTFHMIEHEVVMAAAAPLLVLARPLGAFMWALPHAWRIRVGRIGMRPSIRRVWKGLTSMTSGTVLHGAAIWLWHVPPLFEAALANESLHRLQHASFLVTALIFWHAMRKAGAPGKAVWHLFVTMIHMSVLGALIALSPRVLYRLQTGGASLLGMTPLEDQQLAGIVMWIPAGTVYAGAALLFAALWIRNAGRSGYAPLRP
jgi:putative membrane protein